MHHRQDFGKIFCLKTIRHTSFPNMWLWSREVTGVRHEGKSWDVCSWNVFINICIYIYIYIYTSIIYIFLKFDFYLKPYLKKFGLKLLLFYQPLLFLEKNVPSPSFWRINRIPILHPFCKVGEILLLLILMKLRQYEITTV